MPTFAKLTPRLSPEQLHQLNECRMKLKAVTLADICTMGGSRISCLALNGMTSHSIRQYQWPRQPPSLPPHYWALWRRAIHQAFIRTDSDTYSIHCPLGDWLTDPSAHSKWFFHPTKNQLMLKIEGGFQCFEPGRLSRVTANPTYKATSVLTDLPPGSQPATASLSPDSPSEATMEDFNQCPTQCAADPVPHLPSSLDEAKWRTNPRDLWAVRSLKCKDDGRSVAELIKQGKAIAVSDGSGGEDQTTSAAILTSRHSKNPSPVFPVHITNFVPGNPEDQNSYHGELGGVAGGIVALQILCKYHSIKQGSIEFGLDGEQAMKAVAAQEDPKADAPSYDLLLDIRRKIKELPINVTFRHIKGHQDDHKHISALDRWATLNVQMDTRAKQMLAKARQSHHKPPNQAFGNETVSVRHNNIKLSRFSLDSLYTLLYGANTKAYWATRHNIPPNLIDHINWETQDKALKREPFGKKRWLIKHLCGQCGVGHVLGPNRRRHQAHDRCPRCDAPDETVTHVLRCQAVSARAEWAKAMTHLESWLFNLDTDAHLTEALLGRLTCWQTNKPFPAVEGPRALKTAILEQDRIGWENFLFGRISTKFAGYQQVHYNHLGKQRTGATWSSKLTNQAWLVMWKMWQHRNTINNSGLTKQDKRTAQMLRRQVKQEFSKGTRGLSRLDFHLLEDKYEVLDYGLQDLKDWVHRVSLAREHYERVQMRLRNSLKKSQQFMKDWQARAS